MKGQIFWMRPMAWATSCLPWLHKAISVLNWWWHPYSETSRIRNIWHDEWIVQPTRTCLDPPEAVDHQPILPFRNPSFHFLQNPTRRRTFKGVSIFLFRSGNDTLILKRNGKPIRNRNNNRDCTETFAAAKRCCLGQSGFEFASAAVTYRAASSRKRKFFSSFLWRAEAEAGTEARGSWQLYQASARRWSSDDYED